MLELDACDSNFPIRSNSVAWFCWISDTDAETETDTDTDADIFNDIGGVVRNEVLDENSKPISKIYEYDIIYLFFSNLNRIDKIMNEYLFRNCQGCQIPLENEATVFKCETCNKPYCIECDIFIHETLHSCPSC